ncbi:mechanosensitive ion channel [Ornithinibacillus sp. 4-3]|uniref:Mechanosensitive ion channel n=1 Tax=Ornithinibacillus sp. 4-3 TaxID=3231488 RepID=A0AB39HMN4_9BACI
MFDDLTFSFESMFDSLLMELPNVIKAILLLLLAWGIAVVAKAIIQKAFVKIGVGKALTKTNLFKDEPEAENLLNQIGKLVYILVFVLFLPSVFNALNMTEVSAPISNMMSQFLNYIPNILAAAIIIIIGVFVAKLVKELFKQFFNTVKLDKLFRKVNPNQVGEEQKAQTTLSTVLSNIIYIFVLIPFVTIGLEALNIASISNPIQSVLSDVLTAIPNIFVATVLIVVGYYIGKFLGNLLTNLLQGVGISQIFKSLGFGNTTEPKFDLAKALGTLVQIFIVLFFTVEALHIINLEVLNTIGHAVIQYLPFLLSALLILGVGLFLANLVGNWIKNNTNSPLSAILIKSVIIAFAIFMTLDQLHFATSIVNKAFLLILGGLMVAFAVSFGLGGREFAKNTLEKVQRNFEKKE